MSTLLRFLATIVIFVAAILLWSQGYLTLKPEAIITWSTESEVNTAGFEVYRATQEEGPYQKVTEALIPSKGDPFTGGEYEFRDHNIESGTTYFYQLEELETSGKFSRLPDTVRFEGKSGLYGLIDTINWNILSILLIFLLVVWLWPDRSQPAASIPLSEQKKNNV
ncbi:MAG: hypothetical protein ACPGWR_10320 [Ardenticatenaceae bacterium]